MSVDVGLGLVFNMIQVWFLLNAVAKLLNLKVGVAQHNLSNVHIYENQMEGVLTQLSRDPIDCQPKLIISDHFSLDILMNGTREEILNCFTLIDYKHHEPIKFPFTA